MARALHKAHSQMRCGSWLVSLEFQDPAVAPTHTLTAPDGSIGLSFEVAYGHAFKAAPRMFVSASDMHYVTEDGRKVLDGTGGCRLLLPTMRVLSVVATSSPFIGLFGTVVGIIKAFRDLAAKHAASTNAKERSSLFAQMQRQLAADAGAEMSGHRTEPG